ncbi:hypothetical protein [Mucilaginibacter aquaedulcis]|uniref:hypothetical protein n=1 Tax=Mucilaginibacter aquaedulcis TaxID=1187081 RepID=UPI0025B6220F|nr:hypothetical protein [Mucilaginibacter aquaedulcis]MDN3551411.1 hypothetical protein [Mucilaginibacter aquaedulcis]
MPENASVGIIFTKRSNTDAIATKNYLLNKFTQKEVAKFYRLLEIFESVVTVFHELYPLSSKGKNIRRAVLSKQLSVFYKIGENQITVLTILDNRLDYSKWP